jgi:hypothetical protein
MRSGGKRRFSQAKRSVFDDIQFNIGKPEVKNKEEPGKLQMAEKS